MSGDVIAPTPFSVAMVIRKCHCGWPRDQVTLTTWLPSFAYRTNDLPVVNDVTIIAIWNIGSRRRLTAELESRRHCINQFSHQTKVKDQANVEQMCGVSHFCIGQSGLLML